MNIHQRAPIAFAVRCFATREKLLGVAESRFSILMWSKVAHVARVVFVALVAPVALVVRCFATREKLLGVAESRFSMLLWSKLPLRFWNPEAQKGNPVSIKQNVQL
jgi:hypothetical protein